MILCVHTEGMYVRLRQLWVFTTRENASLAHLTRVVNTYVRTYVRLRQLWVFTTRENASLAHLTRVVNVLTFMGLARHVIWPNKKNLHFSNSY